MKKQLLLLGLGLVLMSCDKDADDPQDKKEEETITTLKLTATPTVGGVASEFIYRPGALPGKPVKIDTIKLTGSSSYRFNLEVLDESANPVKNLTEEINEKAAEHQFFYQSTPTGLITINADSMDKDISNLPVGIVSYGVLTSTISSGSLKITLRHDLNKSAAGVVQGIITNAGGSTDIEATFPVKVSQ